MTLISFRRYFRHATLAGALILFLAPAFSSAQITQNEYASRRAALAALVGDGLLVALGSPEPEQDYIAFYQNSQFEYLTGFNEPNAALILEIKDGKIAGAPHLFVQPADPAQEKWTGKRLGVAGAKALGFESHAADSLPVILHGMLARPGVGTLDVVGNDQPIRSAVSRHPNVIVRNAGQRVLQLRRVKSPAELDLIRKSVAITVDAQREAMRYLEPGQNEFETQALIEYTFRRNGADRPSFSTIIGSGPNSTTLHYNDDDRFFDRNDVVVEVVARVMQAGGVAVADHFLEKGQTIVSHRGRAYRKLAEHLAARPGRQTTGAGPGIRHHGNSPAVRRASRRGFRRARRDGRLDRGMDERGPEDPARGRAGLRAAALSPDVRRELPDSGRPGGLRGLQERPGSVGARRLDQLRRRPDAHRRHGRCVRVV